MKEDWLDGLLDSLRKEEATIKQGGGKKRIEKEHKKGKLTARERIDMLLDEWRRAF
jgi:3-methylcrotonyl-CoA carboxylase beta subunit